mgnify:CR=1 FL=1
MSGLLSSRSKNKRPKFLFFLQVNELVNIPQSSGYCYVKWSIRDGTGTSKNSTVVGDDKQYKVSTQSKGMTPRVKVNHHRAQWNYKLDRPVQIKLQVDRERNLHKKDLSLDIFFEFITENNSNNVNMPRLSTHRTTSTTDKPITTTTQHVVQEKISNKIQLGKVIINLSDYVREDEMPITNRFLLKNSKVNSIINVTIQMKLVRGIYTDFILQHANQSNSSGISASPGNSNNSSRNGFGTHPPIQPLTLIDTHHTNGNSEYGNSSTNQSSPRKSSHSSNGVYPMSPLSGNGLGASTLKSGQSSTTKGLSTISTSMNPLVDSLYSKTFHLPWDPRPNELSPRECIEDIIKGGDGWAKNENGINLIDLQALRLHELELAYYASGNTFETSDYTNNNNTLTIDGNNANKMDNPSEEYWDSMDRREFMERRQEVTTSLDRVTSNTRKHSNNNRKNSIIDAPSNTATARDTRSWSISHVMS